MLLERSPTVLLSTWCLPIEGFGILPIYRQLETAFNFNHSSAGSDSANLGAKAAQTTRSLEIQLTLVNQACDFCQTSIARGNLSGFFDFKWFFCLLSYEIMRINKKKKTIHKKKREKERKSSQDINKILDKSRISKC